MEDTEGIRATSQADGQQEKGPTDILPARGRAVPSQADGQKKKGSTDAPPPPSVVAPLKNTWNYPVPYGGPAAIEGMGLIAAPLLAGFSMALVVLVIDKYNELRFPDWALLLLVLAAVLLIMSVQFTFSARSYFVTPDQLKEWWPDLGDERRWKQQRPAQWRYYDRYQMWAGRARRSYNAAIMVLLLAISVVLVPKPEHAVSVSRARWISIAIPLGGVLFELFWMWSDLRGRRRQGWSDRLKRVVPWFARLRSGQWLEPQQFSTPPSDVKPPTT
jgi:hypothetical protein